MKKTIPLIGLIVIGTVIAALFFFLQEPECESQTRVCTDDLQLYANSCDANKAQKRIIANETCPVPVDVPTLELTMEVVSIPADKPYQFTVANPDQSELKVRIENVTSFVVPPESSYTIALTLSQGSYKVYYYDAYVTTIEVN